MIGRKIYLYVHVTVYFVMVVNKRDRICLWQSSKCKESANVLMEK